MGCCRKVGEGLENSLYEPATSAPVLRKRSTWMSQSNPSSLLGPCPILSSPLLLADQNSAFEWVSLPFLFLHPEPSPSFLLLSPFIPSP